MSHGAEPLGMGETEGAEGGIGRVFAVAILTKRAPKKRFV